MKMALQGTTLLIKDADNVQFTVIKSWNKMKWDRKAQLLRGTADIELLDKLTMSDGNRRERPRPQGAGRMDKRNILLAVAAAHPAP